MADPELAEQSDRRRLYPRRLRALADVLLKHPHVWVLTDDMYEHLTYDVLNIRPSRSRAETLRPHADHERSFQGL